MADQGAAAKAAPVAADQAKKPPQQSQTATETEFWSADSAPAIGGLYGIPNAMFAAGASSPNDMGNLLGGLDGRRSRALALQLQRSTGNASFAGWIARSRRPQGAWPSISIQRCGAEVHEGCPCADGAQAGGMPTAVQSQSTVQRHTEDPKPPPGELGPDSPYLRLPAPLLAVIKKSYTERTMLFAHRDEESLDEVLDRMSTSLVNAMVKIHSRGGPIWSFVDTIVWVWITDNYGMTFKSTAGDIGGTLKDNPSFCKDSALGQIYHSGSQCWREMTDGGAGLHVCVGSEVSMHVDPHMPVKQKGGGSTGSGAMKGAAIGALLGPLGIIVGAGIGAAAGYATGGGESDLGDVCVYDAALWFSHASDVLSGKTGADVFSRVDTARSNLSSLKDRIDFLPPTRQKTRLTTELRVAQAKFDKILAATRSAASRPIDGSQPLDQQIGAAATEIEPHVPDLELVEAEIGRMKGEVDTLAAASAPPLAGGPRPATPPPPASLPAPAPVQPTFVQRTPGQAVFVQRNPVDDAVSKKDPKAVDALTVADIAKATVNQRVQLISIELDGGSGEALPRLWDSFGRGLDAQAVNHPDEWAQSMTKFPAAMRQSREVKTLEAAFALDVRDVAWGYLRDNDAVVKKELARLGIGDKENESVAITAAQAEQMRKTQEAAQKLGEAQDKREALRATEIAFHRKSVAKGGSELPEGGVDNLEEVYEPVSFDPDRPFSAADQPTDYVPGLRTWNETYAQHVQLTKVIDACFTTHPSLYALSRAEKGGAKASAAAKASPEQARKTLGNELRTVRENIAKAHDLVPTAALQMTPIHDQLLKNQLGTRVNLSRDWSNVFLRPVGNDVVAQQQPGPWWQQFGAMALEGAAYVVVGLATGGIGPVLLAGGQAAISVGKYQALEALSRSNVTPDTEMIKDAEVNAAAVGAVMSVVAAFLITLGAARAAFSARVASQMGRTLAKELGEDVARNLLIDLSAEAATALKNKLGADLLKRVGTSISGKTLQKLAGELTAAEIESLLARLSAYQLGALMEKVGTAKLLNSLLGRCADPKQLERLLERVPDASMLDQLLAGVAPADLGKLENVLSVLGEAKPGSLKFNIGGELEATAGSVVINPGRQAMPLDKLRALKPENLIVGSGAERIPFPAGSGRMIVGRKLPNSINWDQAAKEFNRVLQPGGTVQISVYGPPGQLRQALVANGFTVKPPLAEGAEYLVMATKR